LIIRFNSLFERYPKLNELAVKFVKFSKVGIFVATLSLILSYVFLKIIGTLLIPTYIMLYLSMIFLSFLLNSKYTFRAKRTIKKALYYYGSYGLTMILGVLLLTLFKLTLPFENWILAYMVVPFTMTSNFILISFVFKKRN